jgi:hypothetical protein
MKYDFYSTRSILVPRDAWTQQARIAQEQGESKVYIFTG